MTLRTCIRCQTDKPLTEFHTYDGKAKSKCKECAKEYQKELRRRNPESQEKRRRRYIVESLKSGMRYRVGLKYVLEMPTETHAKCTKCKQWKQLNCFQRDRGITKREDYRRTNCKACGYKQRRKGRPPRKKKTGEEKREEYRRAGILSGDGCCLYCGKQNFGNLTITTHGKKSIPTSLLHYAKIITPFVHDEYRSYWRNGINKGQFSPRRERKME